MTLLLPLRRWCVCLGLGVGRRLLSSLQEQHDSAHTVQKLLWSATLPAWVEGVAAKHMHEHELVDVVGGAAAVASLLAAALTGIHLCAVGSGREILRRSGRGQGTASARPASVTQAGTALTAAARSIGSATTARTALSLPGAPAPSASTYHLRDISMAAEILD